MITYWPGIKLSVSETPYSRFFQESRFEKEYVRHFSIISEKKNTGTFKILHSAFIKSIFLCNFPPKRGLSSRLVLTTS